MNTDLYNDIPDYSSWEEVILIEKGYSEDKKYRIKTNKGKYLLLRISDIHNFEKKKKEYDIIHKFLSLGFTMSEPISFGICNKGNSVYMILSWIPGKDLKEELRNLTEKQQYILGRKAGKILKKIHSLSVDKSDIPIIKRKDKKLLQLEKYENSNLRIPDDGEVLFFIRQNIERIENHSTSYLHGDFHPVNLIYTSDGNIGVIDFNRWKAGNPYEEFYKLESFGTEESIPYCIGQIDEYFENKIPEDFWKTLAVYVAHASLYSVKWAEPFGAEDIEDMKKRCEKAFENYDKFRNTVPKWYDNNMHLKYTDNLID